MKSVFSTYHPIINFGFFCAVIGIGIFLIHPVFLSIALAASLTYGIMVGGKGTIKFFLIFLLPMTLIVAIINPVLAPRGDTILFYTKYSYITLEAALYGATTGLMLASILLWFVCYNKIMTTDKFVYLFGRIIPAVSLIFSMVMRFVPNYKMQIKKISNAQKCVGRDVSNGKIKDKIRHGIKILSIMFTWALENAIDSADSMRSRGYGLKNRSTFSIYRFDSRDTLAGLFLLVVTAMVLVGVISGRCSMEFYPAIHMAELGGISLLAYASYVCLCFFPVIIEVKEALTWRHLQSKI